MRHTRWRRDSLTNGRPWTVRAPMDSNSCNFNGTDAAGRMRTGHCRTGGQGGAGSNPVIPTNKYRVESSVSVRPFFLYGRFVPMMFQRSWDTPRMVAI